MKKFPSLLVVIVATSAFATPAHAQTTDVGSCGDVQWKDARMSKSCMAVVERNGKRYIKLSGKVTRKTKDTMTVLLDNSKEELTWMPDLGDMVSIDGKDTQPMSVSIGQPLRFYVPESQVATKN